MSNISQRMLTLAPAPPAGMPGTGASNGAVTGRMGRFDADNPMLWLVGLGAVTLGLISLSTSARFGPIRVSASAG